MWKCLQFKNLDYICNPFAGVVELVDTLDLGIKQEKIYFFSKSGCGGIGRHARLRIWCREVWEFESPRPHFFNCKFAVIKPLNFERFFCLGTT